MPPHVWMGAIGWPAQLSATKLVPSYLFTLFLFSVLHDHCIIQKGAIQKLVPSYIYTSFPPPTILVMRYLFTIILLQKCAVLPIRPTYLTHFYPPKIVLSYMFASFPHIISTYKFRLILKIGATLQICLISTACLPWSSSD
jgi:hypothetical protein